MKADAAPPINKIEAQRFLTALDPTADHWTFQTFDDDKRRKDVTLKRVEHNTLDNIAGALAIRNERGAGIFVTINETDLRGRETKNIKRVRACFVDLDGAPLEPVLSDKDVPAPHIVVETSPSRWHAYWLVDGMELNDFEAAQKILITRYHSDKSIHDLPRVMRLPGFWHRKGEPAQVKIHSIKQSPAYKASEFLTALNTVAPPKKATPQQNSSGHPVNRSRDIFDNRGCLRHSLGIRCTSKCTSYRAQICYLGSCGRSIFYHCNFRI